MAEWTDLMCAPMRELRLGGKIVFASGQELALTGEMVSSLAIEEGADGELAPGSVLSSSCTLDLVNDSGQWNAGGSLLGGQVLSGATLMPELGVMDGETALWRPLGVYELESARYLEGEACLRIEGVDSIGHELAAAFEDGLTYPATLSALWAHAVAQTRYVWSGSVPNGTAVIDAAPDWKGASLRSALGYIAAAAGCFVMIDREGTLALRSVWDASAQPRAIDGQVYLKLERGGATYGPVDALRLKPVGAEEETVYRAQTDGSALFALSVSENPLFQAGATHLDALAEGMLSQVAGYAGVDMRFDWRGDPEACIGDCVAITDGAGEVHTGVISRQSMRFELGFSATVVCSTPQDADSGVRRALTPEGGVNAAVLVGAVDGALLSVGSVTTNKLAAGSVTAEKLAAGSVDAGALSAVTAKIKAVTADTISTDELGAELARIAVLSAGTATFDKATVQHLVAEAMNLNFGTAGQVFIENLAVAYAQMVGATIGELCIKASDGNYYLMDVDADGKVTATQTAVTEGEISAGQTSGGKAILETNITAENLNTSNLLATYALVNRIDAARIDVDELFAREAVINLLKTSKIAGGKSLTVLAGDVETAQSAADSASTAASKAQTTADSASTAATKAQSTADNASSAASSASTAASKAQSTADNAASAASAAQSTADTANTKIDSLEIGGRNLLRGTNEAKLVTTENDANWCLNSGGNGTAALLDLSNDNSVPVSVGFRIQNNTSGNKDFTQAAQYLTGGETYTVSWYARTTGDSSFMLCRLSYRNGGGLYKTVYSGSITNTDWKRFTYTWTQDSYGSDEYLGIQFGAAGTDIDICAMKLEKGNKVTDWTPAPEDAEAYTDAKSVYVSETPPEAPAAGKLWQDQSVTPPVLRSWLGKDVSTEAEFGGSFGSARVQTLDVGRVLSFGGSMYSVYRPYQSGSGDPSKTNVRPISGFTQAKLHVTGKNLLNYEAFKTVDVASGTAVWADNGVTLTATAADCYTRGWRADEAAIDIPAYAGETLTMSWTHSGSDGLVYIFPDGKTTGMAYTNASAESLTYTVPDGARFITFRLGVSASGGVATYKDLQIERGTTATAFEAYRGVTYGFDFGKTLYGGSVYWQDGKWTEDYAFLTLTGTESWIMQGTSTSGKYRIVLPLSGAAGAASTSVVPEILCSHFAAVSASMTYHGTTGISLEIDGSLLFYDESYNTSDVSLWKAFLAAQYAAGTPVQVAYKLAATVEHDAEIGEIVPLTGLNVLTTNGDELHGEYTASGWEVVNDTETLEAAQAELARRQAVAEEELLKLGMAFDFDADGLHTHRPIENPSCETLITDDSFNVVTNNAIASTFAASYQRMGEQIVVRQTSNGLIYGG